MSTDLYGIRVLTTKPEISKITVKVFVVYYDVSFKKHQPLPKDHSFFLRILWDKGDNRFGAGGPIGEEVTVDQIADESWVDKNTFRFIKNVEQLSKMNFPVKDYAGYADFYYERNGAWENEDKLVQATYEIEATDPKYIEHLTEGMSWGTTSYETQAIKVSPDYRNQLPDILRPIAKLQSPEESYIKDAVFSEDQKYLFVLDSAGMIICYRRDNWEIIWSVSSQVAAAEKIEYDNHRRLIWAQNEDNVPKSIFNFKGEMVDETVWPKIEIPLGAAHLSPSGNYFVLPPFIEEDNLTVYDANGNLLWTTADIDGEELRHAFFPKEEKLLVLVLSMGMLRVYDLQSGTLIVEEEYESFDCGYGLSVAPTRQFFSFDETGHSNRGFKHTMKIVDLTSLKTVFEYGARVSPYHNDTDYLSQCIWSPDNQLVAIITQEQGKRGKDGFITIYQLGIE